MFDDPINNFIYLIFGAAGLFGLFAVVFIGLIFYAIYEGNK